MKIKRIVRDLIRDNAVSYSVFLRFYLNKKLRLPDTDTDCHLTGFPRSANTYSHYLAKHLLPEKKFVTHVHTLASLRRARRLGVPISAIIRDPLGTTTSMCMKYKVEPTDASAIREYLYDYKHYHEWIVRHRDEVSLFRFEDVTRNSAKFVRELADVLRVELDMETLDAKLEETQTLFAEREKLKDPDGSSLPQEGRIKRKKDFECAILNNDGYAAAEGIYQHMLATI